MAYFAHADVLENGPAYVKANATKIMLISAYTFGDSYATVDAAKLSEAAVTTANWTWSASGNDRVLTSTDNLTGSVAAASAAGPSNHYGRCHELQGAVCHRGRLRPAHHIGKPGHAQVSGDQGHAAYVGSLIGERHDADGRVAGT